MGPKKNLLGTHFGISHSTSRVLPLSCTILGLVPFVIDRAHNVSTLIAPLLNLVLIYMEKGAKMMHLFEEGYKNAIQKGTHGMYMVRKGGLGRLIINQIVYCIVELSPRFSTVSAISPVLVTHIVPSTMITPLYVCRDDNTSFSC